MHNISWWGIYVLFEILKYNAVFLEMGEMRHMPKRTWLPSIIDPGAGATLCICPYRRHRWILTQSNQNQKFLRNGIVYTWLEVECEGIKSKNAEYTYALARTQKFLCVTQTHTNFICIFLYLIMGIEAWT